MVESMCYKRHIAEHDIAAQARPDLAFFDTIVRLTVEAFREYPRDLRRACLAALVLASMADHYYACHPGLATGKGEYRNFLASLRADFALVRDVAEATKHATLRDDGKGIAFDHVAVRPSPEVSGGYNTGALAYGGPGGYSSRVAIIVTNRDGSVSFLDDAIVSVLAFWERHLSMSPVAKRPETPNV